MTFDTASTTPRRSGDYMVRSPRSTDAIGHALRGVFDDIGHAPDDFSIMLQRLEKIPLAVH